MNKTFLITVALFLASSIYAQDIFRKHGFDKETLTLSKGRYEEVFTNNEVVQIGSVLLNTKTNKVVKFLDEETEDASFKAEYSSRWLSPDPLAEKYPQLSPYVFCNNNPVNLIDPTGMDWYWDKDKTRQYDPNITSQDQLQKGQTYIGTSDQVKDKKGNVTEDYRADGSIMFTNETSAYNRMWSQANVHYEGKKEVGGFTLKNGDVLVLPDYKNDSKSTGIEEYGYSISTKGTLSKDGTSYNITGMMHTHQDKTGDATPSTWIGNGFGDLGISERMGGLPIMTIGHDGFIHAIYAPGKAADGYSVIPLGGLTRSQLLNGTKLVPWLRTYPTLTSK